jgi:hypothetical protein
MKFSAVVLHSFVSVKRKMSLQGCRNRNFFEDKDLKKPANKKSRLN